MKVLFQRNTALKFILKQPQKQKERLFAAMQRLPEGDVVPLAGTPGYYRLRVGEYRVVYAIDWENESVVVHNVGNRGDVYK